jgi:uncharacterized protein (TIGR02001 family)
MPLQQHTFLVATVAAVLTCPTMARAQAAAESAPALTSNIALVSQYVFRGVSYSQERPAVQGGFDYAHASGLYAGIWGTSLSGEAIAGAASEVDLYGGYAGSAGALAYDVGLLQFVFPRGRLNGERYNTLEAYAGVTWQWLNLKYSHTLTDYFAMNAASMGFGDDSKGSHYLEANASYEVQPGWLMGLHVGRQVVRGYGNYSFTDYKASVTRSLPQGWQLGLAWAGTNAERALYRIGTVDTASGKWIASIKRIF